MQPERANWLVAEFFAGTPDRAELLRDLSIDCVLIGPRDRARGTLDPALLPVRLAFRSGDVSIYKREFAPMAGRQGGTHAMKPESKGPDG